LTNMIFFKISPMKLCQGASTNSALTIFEIQGGGNKGILQYNVFCLKFVL